MTTKLFCDVCGVLIPDTTSMEHNEAVEHPQGRFWRGAVVCVSYDLCRECSMTVLEKIEKMRQHNET